MTTKTKPPEELTDAEIDALFNAIDEKRLNNWETSFIKSIFSYWGKVRKLSPRQRRELREIRLRQQNAPKPPAA